MVSGEAATQKQFAAEEYSPRRTLFLLVSGVFIDFRVESIVQQASTQVDILFHVQDMVLVLNQFSTVVDIIVSLLTRQSKKTQEEDSTVVDIVVSS